jgi:hypothetical protein
LVFAEQRRALAARRLQREATLAVRE